LFRIPYRPSFDENGEENGVLHYEKMEDAETGDASISFSIPDQAAQYAWLEFPRGDSWAPERIEVNGRKGRRVVCVFARDRLHYRIYDLDGSAEVEDGERIDVEIDTVMGD
jgi:hypothetical protein